MCFNRETTKGLTLKIHTTTKDEPRPTLDLCCEDGQNPHPPNRFSLGLPLMNASSPADPTSTD